MTERDLKYDINPCITSNTVLLPTRTTRAIAVIERMKDLLKARGKGYIDEDVFADVALTDWLAQVVIKAHRAKRATTLEKMEEELLDTANYCALVITKIQDLKPAASSTSDSTRDMTRTTSYHICE